MPSAQRAQRARQSGTLRNLESFFLVAVQDLVGNPALSRFSDAANNSGHDSGFLLPSRSGQSV